MFGGKALGQMTVISNIQIYVPPLQAACDLWSHGTHMLYLDCQHDPVRD